MPNLWNAFSTVLLGFLWGDVANGILDAGRKFQQVCGNLFGVVTRVFYPFLSRKIDQHALYAKISLLIGLFLSLALLVLAPIIIGIFFGHEFESSIVVLRLFSVSMLFWAMDNVYGVNYMLVQGYDKQLRNITIVSSVIACLSAYPLVYFYSYIGVAIVYNIGLGLMGIFSMLFAVKNKRKVLSNNE